MSDRTRHCREIPVSTGKAETFNEQAEARREERRAGKCF